MGDMPDINLLRPQSFAYPPEEATPPPPRRKKRRLFFIILILISLWGIRHYTLANWPDEAVNYDPVTLQPKKIGVLQTVKNFIFHNNNILEGQADDRINILLLGMGGPGHEGPYLTDTNIIVSFQPSTNQAAMISVPRDLGVKIDGHGLRKINYANAYGEAKNGQGGEYARNIFSQTFDLKIPYYLRVDFTAFRELIDEVGGVTVNVERAFTDTQYPGLNDSYITVEFAAGRQTLKGERALQYARSRHGNNGEGSDFARARRQQQILSALKDRLLSFGTYTNPVRVQKILQSLSNHVTTNLNFGQLMYLANMGRGITGELKMLVLDNQTDGFLISSIAADTGAFLLSPKTGNFSQINQAIKNIFSNQTTGLVDIVAVDTDRSTINQSVFPRATIEVQNGTWRVGLAAKIQKRLQDAGFSVLPPGNSLKRPVDKTVIYLLKPGLSAEVQSALNKALQAETTSTLPDWLKSDYDDPTTPTNEIGVKYSPEASVLIILGEDSQENQE